MKRLLSLLLLLGSTSTWAAPARVSRQHEGSKNNVNACVSIAIPGTGAHTAYCCNGGTVPLHQSSWCVDGGIAALSRDATDARLKGCQLKSDPVLFGCLKLKDAEAKLDGRYWTRSEEIALHKKAQAVLQYALFDRQGPPMSPERLPKLSAKDVEAFLPAWCARRHLTGKQCRLTDMKLAVSKGQNAKKRSAKSTFVVVNSHAQGTALATDDGAPGMPAMGELLGALMADDEASNAAGDQGWGPANPGPNSEAPVPFEVVNSPNMPATRGISTSTEGSAAASSAGGSAGGGGSPLQSLTAEVQDKLKSLASSISSATGLNLGGGSGSGSSGQGNSAGPPSSGKPDNAPASPAGEPGAYSSANTLAATAGNSQANTAAPPAGNIGTNYNSPTGNPAASNSSPASEYPGGGYNSPPSAPARTPAQKPKNPVTSALSETVNSVSNFLASNNPFANKAASAPAGPGTTAASGANSGNLVASASTDSQGSANQSAGVTPPAAQTIPPALGPTTSNIPLLKDSAASPPMAVGSDYPKFTAPPITITPASIAAAKGPCGDGFSLMADGGCKMIINNGATTDTVIQYQGMSLYQTVDQNGKVLSKVALATDSNHVPIAPPAVTHVAPSGGGGSPGSPLVGTGVPPTKDTSDFLANTVFTPPAHVPLNSLTFGLNDLLAPGPPVDSSKTLTGYSTSGTHKAVTVPAPQFQTEQEKILLGPKVPPRVMPNGDIVYNNCSPTEANCVFHARLADGTEVIKSTVNSLVTQQISISGGVMTTSNLNSEDKTNPVYVTTMGPVPTDGPVVGRFVTPSGAVPLIPMGQESPSPSAVALVGNSPVEPGLAITSGNPGEPVPGANGGAPTGAPLIPPGVTTLTTSVTGTTTGAPGSTSSTPSGAAPASPGASAHEGTTAVVAGGSPGTSLSTPSGTAPAAPVTTQATGPQVAPAGTPIAGASAPPSTAPASTAAPAPATAANSGPTEDQKAADARAANDDCSESARLSGKMGCNKTKSLVENSKYADQAGQLLGSMATAASGGQAQDGAQSAGTQSAAVSGAANVSESSGMMQMAMGMMNAGLGYLQLQAEKEHSNNIKTLNADPGKADVECRATPGAAPAPCQLYNAGATAGEISQRYIDNHAGQDLMAVKTGLSTAKDQAIAEQKAVKGEAESGGEQSLITGLGQLAAGKMAVDASKDLRAAATALAATDNSYVNIAPGSATAGGAEALAARQGTSLTGTGQSAQTAAADGSTTPTTGTPTLGNGFNTSTPTGDLTGPAAGARDGAAPTASTGTGAGGAALGGGGTAASAGGSDPSTSATTADSKPVSGDYQPGGGVAGGRGGSGGSGGAGGPDLNGLLAKFLPQKEEEAAKGKGILDFGGRGPASDDSEMGMNWALDSRSNIFEVIHRAYQDKQRRGIIGH